MVRVPYLKQPPVATVAPHVARLKQLLEALGVAVVAQPIGKSTGLFTNEQLVIDMPSYSTVAADYDTLLSQIDELASTGSERAGGFALIKSYMEEIRALGYDKKEVFEHTMRVFNGGRQVLWDRTAEQVVIGRVVPDRPKMDLRSDLTSFLEGLFTTQPTAYNDHQGIGAMFNDDEDNWLVSNQESLDLAAVAQEYNVPIHLLKWCSIQRTGGPEVGTRYWVGIRSRWNCMQSVSLVIPYVTPGGDSNYEHYYAIGRVVSISYFHVTSGNVGQLVTVGNHNARLLYRVNCVHVGPNVDDYRVNEVYCDGIAKFAPAVEIDIDFDGDGLDYGDDYVRALDYRENTSPEEQGWWGARPSVQLIGNGGTFTGPGNIGGSFGAFEMPDGVVASFPRSNIFGNPNASATTREDYGDNYAMLVAYGFDVVFVGREFAMNWRCDSITLFSVDGQSYRTAALSSRLAPMYDALGDKLNASGQPDAGRRFKQAAAGMLSNIAMNFAWVEKDGYRANRDALVDMADEYEVSPADLRKEILLPKDDDSPNSVAVKFKQAEDELAVWYGRGNIAAYVGFQVLESGELGDVMINLVDGLPVLTTGDLATLHEDFARRRSDLISFDGPSYDWLTTSNVEGAIEGDILDNIAMYFLGMSYATVTRNGGSSLDDVKPIWNMDGRAERISAWTPLHWLTWAGGKMQQAFPMLGSFLTNPTGVGGLDYNRETIEYNPLEMPVLDADSAIPFAGVPQA